MFLQWWTPTAICSGKTSYHALFDYQRKSRILHSERNELHLHLQVVILNFGSLYRLAAGEKELSVPH